MLVVLDTDHVSVLQHKNQPDYSNLSNRLQQLRPEDKFTTVVSFQEQLKGWLAYINRAVNDTQIVRAYKELADFEQDYCEMQVLPFDSAAQQQFVRLRRQHVRIGTLDVRIAAIALATGAKLLSRNLRDFRQVPGLDVEDWTV